ncbi:MAG TPA: serine hydrolase domain-containing protein [Microthrixaceae bacterium]|nr:serine hydrolase domain-containing protein [Microthrixaceae bacterium]
MTSSSSQTPQFNSDEGLAPDQVEKLRRKIAAEIDSGRMPSAQFAFARNGQVELAESFGTASNSTAFNIFSATKALIAGVVWQLIGEGKLRPDTLAVELIPEFGSRGTTPEWLAQVTLEHLLTHTSGFPTAPLGPPKWDTRDGRLDVMSRWRGTFEPGTHFEYHPTAAHWVVAEMIEAVEGIDFREVVRARILEPLSLTDLHLGPDSAAADVAPLVAVGDLPSAAEIAEVFGDIEFELGEVTPEILLAFNDPSIRAVGVPGGGGTATASALATYYQALLHNTGELWDPNVLADGTGTIRCTLPDPMSGVPANRTLGLVRSGDDGKSSMRGMGPTVSSLAFGHNGAGGQIVWADPETGYSFAFTTSAIERNFIREARRILSITSRAGLCTRPGMNLEGGRV